MMSFVRIICIFLPKIHKSMVYVSEECYTAVPCLIFDRTNSILAAFQSKTKKIKSILKIILLYIRCVIKHLFKEFYDNALKILFAFDIHNLWTIVSDVKTKIYLFIHLLIYFFNGILRMLNLKCLWKSEKCSFPTSSSSVLF